MNTVKLFKWTNLQAVDGWDVKTGFAFQYCEKYGFVDCDNGADYELPDGYEVAESNAGTTEIYDNLGSCCILEVYKGRPILRSSNNPGLTLRLVGE
jgi:hypothetical protein